MNETRLARAQARVPRVAPRATVVVPTYNEANNLRELVRRVHAAAPDVEILIVDDGSPDGTAELARELALDFPVRVVERSGERGLSTAVLRGIAEAETDVVAVMDADLSHPPEALPGLLQAVEDGADVAVGSRYVPGGEIDAWPLRRRFTSWCGTFLARPLTAVRDPMAGFFCLRGELLRCAELKPRGFKILLEILARAKPARVVEVPIRFDDREAGASKFGGRERREFLRQIATLYRDVNAWPFRAAKFCAVGALGAVLHLAALVVLVELGRIAPGLAATLAFCGSMSCAYVVNRRWTFRAKECGVFTSYPAYAAGALAGLALQLAAMEVLATWHYALSAALGVALGSGVTYLSGEAWAFAKRG